MSAKLHWMSSKQYNPSYLSYLASTAENSSSDLTCDANRAISSCERISLCVDLSLSLEGNGDTEKTDCAYELKSRKMEPNSMGPQIDIPVSCGEVNVEGNSDQIGIPVSCGEVNLESNSDTEKSDCAYEFKPRTMESDSRKLQIGIPVSCEEVSLHENVQSSRMIPCADTLSASLKFGRILESTCDSNVYSAKAFSSADNSHEGGQNAIKKNIAVPAGRVHGSMSLKQAARQFYQQLDEKSRKREGTEVDREASKKKKSRPTASNVAPVKNENDALKMPAMNVVVKNFSIPKQKKSILPDNNETQSLVAKLEGDLVSGLNSREPTASSRVQPKSRVQDITKEEAAAELQQCVSLLRKYGILNSKEYYLSQCFPNCAPHPGFVGNKDNPTWCKICGAVEDATNTVICDECQQAFHLSCCLPRLNPKHFDKEDDWYCSSCRKQRRRAGKSCSSTNVDASGDSGALCFISKVKVGPAYQADVPPWTEKPDCVSSAAGDFGIGEPFSKEAKDKEKTRLRNEFEQKAEAWKRKLVSSFSDGMHENWLRCNSVLVKAFKDSEGHKHNEIICGKWRRAPLDAQQSDRWECFCAIDWDPYHADCAVPQALKVEDAEVGRFSI
ncbi:hypothetical protein KP509_25G003300 [Ceratopteris richardii]|uniref:PHD-type domain-containing protein n=1 Tax=Ceratopteris richardii TaxID=49495 RepID=A0A8T2RMD2_CERRI|nr:hypothetical protein KP509_25G003300 [Ceratopteris richardii]